MFRFLHRLTAPVAGATVGAVAATYEHVVPEDIRAEILAGYLEGLKEKRITDGNTSTDSSNP